MPIFNYVARDLQGVDHKGSIETSDERQVARLLSKRHLILISAKKVDKKGSGFLDQFLNKVSFNDLVIATRQLATMIEAGLVLSEALDILVEQQSNKNFKEVLSDVSRNVKSGMEFASALRKHPHVFPALYSNLVEAGESSGKLDTTLKQMAANLEKEREFKSRVRGAFIYPIMVILMMFVVMFIMVFFVVPKLTSLYTQSNIELPLPTKILIFISTTLTNFWWIFLILLFLGGLGFKKWIATPDGRYKFDSFLLKIPIVGKIIQGTTLTEFTRTFGLLTASGIPLLNALSIVANVIGNSVYKKALQDSFRGVERGLAFSTQVESTGVFPRIIPQMYRVGEETGKVDEVSFKMAEYFEQEADHLVKNLTVVIEPVILVFLGIGVAFLVLSIILPIYKLTTSFG